MNETRSNSRTKPMRGGLKGGEINSLKDSEKTNVNIIKVTIQHNINQSWSMPYTYIIGTKSTYDKFNINLQKLIIKFSK